MLVVADGRADLESADRVPPRRHCRSTTGRRKRQTGRRYGKLKEVDHILDMMLPAQLKAIRAARCRYRADRDRGATSAKLVVKSPAAVR